MLKKFKVKMDMSILNLKSRVKRDSKLISPKSKRFEMMVVMSRLQHCVPFEVSFLI
jgi:hypothetical protein